MLIPTFLRTFYLPCAVNVRIYARGAYPISSNNSRGRLFFFSHQKGVIISNIAQWKSCPIDCFPMTSRQPYLCTKQWIGGHVCVQKKSVGIELFSHVKTFFYSRQFAKLLTTWLKTDYILCFIIPLKQKNNHVNKLNMGFLSVPNLVPWLISDVNILDVRVWMINDQFCCISLHFSYVCYSSCQFLTWQ